MLVITLVSAASLGACAGGTENTDGASSVGSAARVAATSVPPIRADLLRVDEVRPFIAFGFDIREQPVLDAKQFNLATLRGPCGAMVTTPFPRDTGFRVFRSTISLIVESAADPGTPAATAFVDGLAADQHEGCPAFEEQVGNAASAKVELVGPLALPAVGDQRIGWEQRVAGPDGTTGYRYVVVVRQQGAVLLLAALTKEAVDRDSLNRLVSLAASGT